mmetsp:Transcript_33281/g.83413  ORF Transcript_33281/g.83413 Transcript_33281/m.83413 type:complete len:242 (+) Transcript_33281:3-728(+)
MLVGSQTRAPCAGQPLSLPAGHSSAPVFPPLSPCAAAALQRALVAHKVHERVVRVGREHGAADALVADGARALVGDHHAALAAAHQLLAHLQVFAAPQVLHDRGVVPLLAHPAHGALQERGHPPHRHVARQQRQRDDGVDAVLLAAQQLRDGRGDVRGGGRARPRGVVLRVQDDLQQVQVDIRLLGRAARPAPCGGSCSGAGQAQHDVRVRLGRHRPRAVVDVGGRPGRRPAAVRLRVKVV